MCHNFCADIGDDVIVLSNSLRPTTRAPMVSVFFFLTLDGVSQEIDEAFNITLVLNAVTVVPDFFDPNISISIIDRDSEFGLFILS